MYLSLFSAGSGARIMLKGMGRLNSSLRRSSSRSLKAQDDPEDKVDSDENDQ